MLNLIGLRLVTQIEVDPVHVDGELDELWARSWDWAVAFYAKNAKRRRTPHSTHVDSFNAHVMLIT